jgi:hypothetical protein
VVEAIRVAPEREPDGLDALPQGGRYRLPSFVDSGDDEVN